MRQIKFILFLLSISAFAQDGRKPIVIIDTGFRSSPVGKVKQEHFCKNGKLDVTDTTTTDFIGHGTNIIGTINEGIDHSKYCIVSIKWFNSYDQNNSKNSDANIIAALKLAKSLKPYLLNLSLTAPYAIPQERYLINEILNIGSYVVIAAGNNGMDLTENCLSFPTCYKFDNIVKLFSVGMLTERGTLHSLSNRGGPVNSYEDGSNVCSEGICQTGTSQAAAVKSNKILRGLK